MPVNKDRVRLLVDALRSGKHKQGQMALTAVRGGEEYDCCMGVGCKLAVEAGVIPDPILTDSREKVYGVKDGRIAYSSSCVVFPKAVQEWFGFEDNDPWVMHKGKTHPVSELNDLLLLSFLEIADVLEENFLKEG